ncbi:MAG TPA: type II secretion system secretin GspD [Vicinamibacterales bacterium]|nr:type II secretion system secretin GspD [Vicinamibacterales bacterium]
MKFRTLLVAFALSLLIVPALSAQYTINMRDVDVRAFASDAAKVTGLTLVVDGRVNQKISVVSQRSMSRTEYFEVFLSTLRANGLVAIPIRGGYRIQPFEGAASQPTRVTRNAAASSQFVTEIIRLRSIDAPGALETVRPLVSPQGTVTANRNANSLVVVDFADNVRRIRQLLATMQGGGSGASGPDTQIVYLRNAGPREIASSLQQLGGTGASVSVSAMDSANAILLRGDSTAVARFARLVRDLDARAVEGTEIRVYWLEHADAEQLLPVLQQLVGQAPSEPSAAPDFIRGQQGEGTGAGPANPGQPVIAAPAAANGTGIVRRGPAVVTRYPGTNAVIIAANADAQRQLGEVVRQLDTRREQVLVEAIIVEIGDEAARRLGVQFLLAGKNAPFAATNWSNAQPNIFTVGGALANETIGRTTTTTDDGVTTTTTQPIFGEAVTAAAVQSVINSTGGFAGGIAEVAKNVWFGSIINAVQSDTSSNILSTPSIMTLDNQEAKLLVGQEVPVTTGEQLGSNFENAFRTVQRQNVGIQLDVKPQVNSSGSIKLFIRQEVSSVAGPVSPRSSDLIINKREFKTVLTVDDGEILAIGGLLDDAERRTLEKVPFLGDIPLLGELFKSRSRSRAKTNLMVFIRPTIIRSRAEARQVSAQRYGYIRGEQVRRNPDVEPSLDSLVRDYMGTVPPGVALQPEDRTYPPAPVPSQPQ